MRVSEREIANALGAMPLLRWNKLRGRRYVGMHTYPYYRRPYEWHVWFGHSPHKRTPWCFLARYGSYGEVIVTEVRGVRAWGLAHETRESKHDPHNADCPCNACHHRWLTTVSRRFDREENLDGE